MPKIDFPKFELPKVELPKVDLPKVELTAATKPFYAGVGATDLAVERVKDTVVAKVEEKKAGHDAAKSGSHTATGPVDVAHGDPIADAITEERVEAVERIIPDEVQN